MFHPRHALGQARKERERVGELIRSHPRALGEGDVILSQRGGGLFKCVKFFGSEKGQSSQETNRGPGGEYESF